MRLLCRYAGGLACLVTMLALVGCGGGPGSQPEPKEIPDKIIDWDGGERKYTIPLSDKFSGENLTYTAESNRLTVATVAVAADILTVTAVSPGTATITVTATNSQGPPAHQYFTVTVPKPAAPAPDPKEIQDFTFGQDETVRRIPLGDKFSGANLTYSATTSDRSVATATVDNAADTVTVTAVGPGTATITVTATAQGSAPQTKTFTVTVPEAASAETAPTVKTGATSTVSVAVGATSTVTLSTVFDGATSYTVSPSASTIATASESGGTLTITGVSSGPATITIVATNGAGSVTHPIAVTVTAPVTTTPETPTTSSGTLTIKRGESAKRTLSSGQDLQEPAGGGVTVEPSPDGETGNVWLITAKKKGTHKVTVLSAGKAVSTITVEVPNSPPIRTDVSHPEVIEISNKDTYSLIEVDTFFTDADEDTTTSEDEEPQYYRVEDKPSWFLINTVKGFVNGDDGSVTTLSLTYEVLQKVTRSVGEYDFTVSLYASDGEDESTRPILLKFKAPDTSPPVLNPRDIDYTVRQLGSGDFEDVLKDDPPKNQLDVGPRRGVIHTAQFSGTAGFVFAVEEAQKLSKRLPTTDVLTNASIYYKAESGAIKRVGGTGPEEPPTGKQIVGTHYYLIKSTNAVIVDWDETKDALAIGDPIVPFKLKEQGNSGTIVIEYHVWPLGRDKTTDEDLSEIEVSKRSSPFSKTLRINVVTCSSPPDPIAACP